MNFFLHTGSIAREEEEQTMMHWINFLQEVEGMHLRVEIIIQANHNSYTLK